MAIILRRFPLFEQPKKVFFQERELTIKTNQLRVWVSLSESQDDPGKNLLPALIDTGCGFTFVMTAEQMHSWCHLHPVYEATPVRLNGINHSRAPFVRLWLYPSSADSASEASLERPILLKTRDLGVAVNTQATPDLGSGNRLLRHPFPRVPLLGMLALKQNRLRLFVDAWRSRFSLYQGRIWPWQW